MITFEFGEGIVPLNQSSCFVQGRWEWSRSAASGKYSRRQQAYREPRLEFTRDSNFPSILEINSNQLGLYSSTLYNISEECIAPTTEVTTSRLRIRGSGKTLNLYFENEPGKGFHLLGWAAPVLINKRP